MINLSSVTSDQMELLFMLLKLQNADKRVCDLFPSYRTEKFCQLDLVRRQTGYVVLYYNTIRVMCFDGEVLYCFSDPETESKFDLPDLLKYISFEDKI